MTTTEVPSLPRGTQTADEQRRRDLRRMKVIATGLIVLAAVVYLVAARW